MTIIAFLPVLIRFLCYWDDHTKGTGKPTDFMHRTLVGLLLHGTHLEDIYEVFTRVRIQTANVWVMASYINANENVSEKHAVAGSWVDDRRQVPPKPCKLGHQHNIKVK
jgi:hypothetical protein